MTSGERRFYYGKYRGIVTKNKDDKGMGRIKAIVPDVKGNHETDWALPCVPYAGKGVGFLMIPPRDANVWIEFENGHWDHPIWTGCFWDKGDVPGSAEPDTKIIKTGQATITINDSKDAAGLTIETKKGLKIILNNDGIELSYDQVKIQLQQSQVAINGNALEVMT